MINLTNFQQFVNISLSKFSVRDDDKMNTLGFVNFLLVKLFPILIRQNFPLSKICAIWYQFLVKRHYWCTSIMANHYFELYNVIMINNIMITHSFPVSFFLQAYTSPKPPRPIILRMVKSLIFIYKMDIYKQTNMQSFI